MVTLDRVESESERFYVRSDSGLVVPSVTTILGCIPKPFMPSWTAKLAAGYAVDNLDSLVGLEREEAMQIVLDETDTLRWEGARKGTAVHDYAEALLTYGMNVPPSNRAEESVCEILEILSPEILHTEGRVWNGTIGYAGTFDGVWRVGGETWLVDWKTSQRKSADWVLQQDAYAHAETIITAAGEEIPMPSIDRLYIAWVRFDHPWQLLPLHPRTSDWETFQAAARLHAWTSGTKISDVFGGTPITASK